MLRGYVAYVAYVAKRRPKVSLTPPGLPGRGAEEISRRLCHPMPQKAAKEFVARRPCHLPPAPNGERGGRDHVARAAITPSRPAPSPPMEARGGNREKTLRGYVAYVAGEDGRGAFPACDRIGCRPLVLRSGRRMPRNDLSLGEARRIALAAQAHRSRWLKDCPEQTPTVGGVLNLRLRAFRSIEHRPSQTAGAKDRSLTVAAR